MNKYTSYRVDVRGGPNMNPSSDNNLNSSNMSTSTSSMFQNPGYSAVLRRYSDFLWLYEKLHAEKAGAIVPPLPEKQPVGRFSAAFIEDRRVNLERFLRRVAIHPELHDSKCLNTFLRADDATFHTAKHSNWEQQQQVQNLYQNNDTGDYHPHQPQPKQGLTSWLSSASSNIASKVINSPVLVHSPDDDLFQEIETYVAGLESQMRTVSQQATTLVRKGKEMANGLFEFGLAFSLLGQSEDGGILGDSLQKMGEVADQLSVMTADHAEKEGVRFEDPLSDYLRMIAAVKIALQKRNEKRKMYSNSLMDMTHRETQSMKLKGILGKEEKSYQADMALEQAKKETELAREEFATVSQRVLREVDRFKREKADDMRRTVMDYIDLQIEYNKRMEQVWAGLIPQLEKANLSEADESGNENHTIQ